MLTLFSFQLPCFYFDEVFLQVVSGLNCREARHPALLFQTVIAFLFETTALSVVLYFNKNHIAGNRIEIKSFTSAVFLNGMSFLINTNKVQIGDYCFHFDVRKTFATA